MKLCKLRVLLATVALAIGVGGVNAVAASTTPELSVSGETLSWTKVGGIHFVVERTSAGEPTTFAEFEKVLAEKPPADPGHTASFRVRRRMFPNRWSNQVSITYPPSETQAEREAREKAEREQKEKEEREKEAKRLPHIMVVVEENRNRNEVIGSSSWPYLNSLATKYGNTTNWSGVSHPSLPNYLGLASGSTQSVTDDGCGYSFAGQTIGSQLSTAGVGWHAYMEGLPSAGSTVCEASGGYAKKHNPFAYFPGSNGSNVVPASQFSTTNLPPFVWFTPNLCNDGHDCSGTTPDNYLKGLIPGVLASKWYEENGTIIITWDEDNGEGKVATVVLHGAGNAKTETTAGNHYGTLATVEDLYKVPRLGSAAGATTLAPLLEEPTGKTIKPAPLGPPIPSGGWVVEYGDAFNAPIIGTPQASGAPVIDNTWHTDNGVST